MKTKIIFCLFCASCCFGGAKTDLVAINLERSKNPIRLTWTESTDTTVSAKIKRYGADFDTTGWTGLLWYGSESGGVTVTNTATSRGVMTWDVTQSLMPTNGRYEVMIFGNSETVSEEWATGVLTVRLNPAKGSLPAEWNTSGYVYDIATNALALAESSLQPTSTNGWETGSHATFIGAGDATNIAQAIVAPVIADVAGLQTSRVDKVWSSVSNYVDGAGVMWEIATITNTIVAYVVVEPTEYWNEAVVVGDVFYYHSTTNAAFPGNPPSSGPYVTSNTYYYLDNDINSLLLEYEIDTEYGGGGYWDLPTIEDLFTPYDYAADNALHLELVGGGIDVSRDVFMDRTNIIDSIEVVTNIVDRTVTTNGTVIIIGDVADSTGSVTQLTARAGSETVTMDFFGRAEAEAAVDAIPRVPTNAVSGWLLYDGGSNVWLSVSVSNFSFTVHEVVE